MLMTFCQLLQVILNIVNLSIVKGVFPKSEKLAIVKPVLKSRNLDPQSLNSYRPVSNLSFLSKIIENVIIKQLFSHLVKINVLPDNQSAYRQFYSTETSLCGIMSEMLMWMDGGHCGLLIGSECCF